jgi:putative acetyltransferase
MQILHERPRDAEAIHTLTQHAFLGHPHSEQTEAAIIRALRTASALSLSLVAIEDNQLVGHLAFSPVTIDGADIGYYGLGPVWFCRIGKMQGSDQS